MALRQPFFIGGIVVRGTENHRKQTSSFLDSVPFLVVINAAGTALGCTFFTVALRHYGIGWVEAKVPNVLETSAWAFTERVVDTYGLFGVFFSSTLPLIPHPTIVIATLAKMNPATLIIGIFMGRAVKYAIMSHCALLAAPFEILWRETGCFNAREQTGRKGGLDYFIHTIIAFLRAKRTV